MALKEIIGKVISDKMNKTITVGVSNKIAHKKYKKIISKTKKYFVHDENNQYKTVAKPKPYHPTRGFRNSL